MEGLTNQDIDAVIEACQTWALMHHRTKLTVQEAAAMRVKLKQRLHNQMQAKPDQLELVKLAHRLANEAIDARRDTAQKREHARMVRA